MIRLAPNLFQRRYDDLVGLGLSKLPSTAPAWTDYNAHDPGITLLELLAWVGEAQLYSLARSRRDERQAYAALMGVEPHGPRPARGLLWADHDDPLSPSATFTRGTVIEQDSTIRLEKSSEILFHAEYRQQWIPAAISGLETRLSDGSIVSQLAANQRGGPVFQPFGADESRDALLRMTLVSTGEYPLFENGRPTDARLMIGVRADAGTAATGGSTDAAKIASPLEVTLVIGDDRIALPIIEDSSCGMLRTGALVLDISAVHLSPKTAILEFRAPGGLDRAPRLVRIEPNAVPIIQRRQASTTYIADADGFADQAFDLETAGLEFEPGTDPVTLEVLVNGAAQHWSKADRLDDCGPLDTSYALDTSAAQITFGNGVNGAIPPPDSQVVATYFVNQGQAGNIAANRKWVVGAFAGVFGNNPDSISGGEDASDWAGQRSDARAAFHDDHALVSAADFEQAAELLPGLEVGRAFMVPLSPADLAIGRMRLVAMRSRYATRETDAIPETRRWLESIRQRLAPRVPLGSRLQVIAPQYAEFTISTTIEAKERKNPADVAANVTAELARRLTLVSNQAGALQRPFGLQVSRRDIVAWILALADVSRVRALAISIPGAASAGEVDYVPVAAAGLPRIDLDNSTITVVRSGEGVQ